MSKIDLEKLEDSQFDVLKEIGNIGAGNATTALATMLNIKVDMSVPNVALLPFDNISSFIGSEEQTVVGILLEIQGDIDGMMMFLFDMKSAHHLVNSLMMRDVHQDENGMADLSKMELVYYGIKVGACKETELTIDKEFDFQKKKAEVTAESILDGDAQSHNEELYVYDIVLAGVEA